MNTKILVTKGEKNTTLLLFILFKEKHIFFLLLLLFIIISLIELSKKICREHTVYLFI